MALLSAVLMLTPIAVTTGASENNDFPAMGMENKQESSVSTQVITADASDKESIEDALNLANVNPEWTYSDLFP